MTVVVLGNFDGVHLGHQQLFKTVKDVGFETKKPVEIITFTPHPRKFFQPGAPPFLLTTDAQRQKLFRLYGVKSAEFLEFNQALAQQAPKQFFETVLLERGIEHLIVGYDFQFGHRRLGNTQVLRELCRQHNIDITVVAQVLDKDNRTYSSSTIRDSLRSGDVKQANTMLGRNWQVRGIVVEGAKRGRTIGFPTANIVWQDYVVPKYGVYVVRINNQYNGVANIGIRPTVDGKQHNLEVHIFDFDQDIYGQELSVDFIDFIRAEQKFDNLDQLKDQIDKDIKIAENIICNNCTGNP